MMTDAQIWDRLICKVQAGLRKMGIPELTDITNHRYGRYRRETVGFGYKDGEYSDMYFPERRNILQTAFHTESEEEMVYYILSECARNYAWQYEREHRAELLETWHSRIAYDGRKHWFAMAIQLLHRIYPLEHLETLIQNETDSLNLWFQQPAWFFDRETLEFAETGKIWKRGKGK